MNFKTLFIIALMQFLAILVFAGEHLVYEGESGPGKGKHIVFLASDHEYKSEEVCPALARILAKNFGFKCTVLFGLNAKGEIQNGSSNIPGMEALETADLLFMGLRFQDWNDEQMGHFLKYMDSAKPIIGIRTSTHAFKLKDTKGKYAKFDWNHKSEDKWNKGFGAAVLGIGWQGHHGRNHRQATRIDIVEEKKSHPILKGVYKPWAYCGGYGAQTPADCNILAMAQPLNGMTYDSPVDEKLKPQSAAWTRSYEGKDGKKGRVFCTTYGSSNCIENDDYRRMLLNACFWAVGLEDKIVADSKIDFIGPFNPTFGKNRGRRAAGVKPLDMSGWDTPIVPLRETK